ncbi:hypothetical protein L0156_01010 [bacterium]|nr:hypothetical protein [bacterium]
MEEFILSKTSLPNLHPAMVHFPVVLLFVALVIDIAALILSREWLRKSAVLLYVFGAAAAGLTFWSGRSAAESVQLSAQVEPILSRHENSALYTLWFFGIYAAIRLLMQLSPYKRWVHAVIVLFSIAGQILLFRTADLGGTLVYKHAVAVTLPKAEKAMQPPAQPAAGPVIQGDNFSWKFGPGSEKRLSEFLDVPTGSLSSVKTRTEQRNGKTVLVIEKSTPEPIVFTVKSASYRDVQIESELDLSEFDGTVSLVHHVSGNDRDFLAIRKGSMELGRHATGSNKSFGTEKLTIPPGLLTFKAVSAGTHYRVYLNGKLTVHGHGKAATEGKAGLLLEGTGILRIANISVTPLLEHDQH